MAKGSAKSTAEIQRLLTEKQQIEQWLERLKMAADKTPHHVRDRVAGDYEKRLHGVVEELQGYRDELATGLQRQLSKREELRKQEGEAAERLAEAELRHTVGEYDESRWTELKTGILESLVEIREGLKGVDSEIKTLESVVSLLEPGQGAVGAFGDEDEDQGEPAGVLAGDDGTGDEGDHPPADAFDELAFLKSVTAENAAAPAPEGEPSFTAAMAEDAMPQPAPNPPRPSARTASKKTLKCVECGTMNLPTEWYCERCGAELAAL